MSIYLGIDIGTSGTKTLVCRENGEVLATATAPHKDYHEQPGWSEQEPDEWWRATLRSVKAAIAKAGVPGMEVKGIGLSGQMHGSVFVDRKGKVLRRAILWNDQRTQAECDEIEAAAGGRSELIKLVSNPAFTGFTAPKILWVRKHQPGIYEQTKKILLPKDYIRYRLTGEYATEVSDASGTLLLDVTQREWCKELLNKLTIDIALLPRCYESQEVSGKVTKKVAEQIGLAEGTPVVGGGGDQAAGAVGNGIVKPGILSATMGTSGVVFAHSEKPETHPQGKVHTMCHAVRGAWHMMGVVLSAGGSLQWFRNKLGEPEVKEARRRKVDAYEVIIELAAKAPLGSEGLYFLPYLTGERHPHPDSKARGGWIGLTVRHDREHLARSVIEGATFAMRDCLEVMRGMGVTAEQIRLSGGGARSAFWRQLQADVYGQKVATINATEGPAYGVALLAMVGTGAYQTVPEACDATIKVTEELSPSAEAMVKYERYYGEYRQFYEVLKPAFGRIGELVSADARRASETQAPVQDQPPASEDVAVE
jgi:xylulokinase